jgi:hypothetical protein
MADLDIYAISPSILSDIADSIRSKTGDDASFAPSDMASAIDSIQLDTPEITITSSGSVSQELQPDTIYHFTSESLTDLTITFSGTGQYHFDFISPATPVTLTLPSTIIMPTDFGVERDSKYEIDIVDNYGVYAVWVYEVA